MSAPHVVVRKGLLKELHTLFFDKLRDLDSPVVAIVGNSAEGKTELAKQYARQFRDQYHHIWFVEVENWEKEYRNLALLWKLFDEAPQQQPSISIGVIKAQDHASVKLQTNPPAQQPIKVVVNAIHKVFRGQSGQEKSLLIFDDVPPRFILDKLGMQLPLNTHILVTSKNPNWEHTLSLSVETNLITLEEGTEILRGWISEERFNASKAVEIVKRLSYLPAPIAQAGHYIAKAKTMRLCEYLPLFETKRKEILSKGKHPRQHIDIVASLQLSIEQLRAQTPRALDLLFHCVYLPNKNIPTDLLMGLFKMDQRELNDRLEALETLVILDTKRVTIHDLFQNLLSEDHSKEEKEKYRSTLSMMPEGFVEFLETNPAKTISIYKAGWNTAQKQKNINRIISLAIKLGQIHIYTHQFDQALGYYRTALGHVDQFSGEKKHVLGGMLFNTGNYYSSQGYINRALEFYHEALNYFSDNIELKASCMLTIASCYASNGKYKRAFSLCDEILRIVDENDPVVDACFNNMANWHFDQKNYVEALKIHERALMIRRRRLGDQHLFVAISLSNIGRCYHKQGNDSEALRCYTQALGIMKNALGENHLLFTVLLADIAESHSSQGQYGMALECLNKALKIRLGIIGEGFDLISIQYLLSLDDCKRKLANAGVHPIKSDH